MLTLGLDAGGGATRWALVEDAADAGRIVARGEAGPCSGHIFDPAVRAKAAAAFDRIAGEALAAGRPERIAGGVTGLGGGTPQAAEMAGWLAARFRIPVEAVTLGDDLWIAAAGLFAPGEGAVVYAGTGAIGYAIGADGRAVKVGGRGVVVDDAGGAWWIATQGLRAVFRADDEGRRTAALADRLADRLGAADWATVRAHVYAADRGGVAALAPFVAEAAEAGDGEAAAILDRAGAELARIGRLIAARAGVGELAMLGGAFRLGPRVEAAFRSGLGGGLVVTAPALDAAVAAARLAAEGRRAPAGT